MKKKKKKNLRNHPACTPLLLSSLQKTCPINYHSRKGSKEVRKAIIAKNVSHDETPIKQLCSESVKQTKNIYII